jgi:hypothetical protein
MASTLRSKTFARRALTTLLALASLAASAGATEDPLCDSGDGKGRKQLRVVGLTSDSRLI